MPVVDPSRRRLLGGLVRGALLATAAGAGLLRPRAVLARDWPAAAFRAESVQAALAALYAGAEIHRSDAVTIHTPLISENGLAVKIEIEAALPGTDRLSLLLPDNPHPLAMDFHLSPPMEAFVGTRYKLAKSTQARALVRAGGAVYEGRQKIRVVQGGCGGNK